MVCSRLRCSKLSAFTEESAFRLPCANDHDREDLDWDDRVLIDGAAISVNGGGPLLQKIAPLPPEQAFRPTNNRWPAPFLTHRSLTADRR